MIDALYTPKNLVAGSIPFSGDDPFQAAWHAAAHALDTERVHVIHNVAQDRIWYIAAPSKDFASYPDSSTPLASALPGMPHHHGDAAYVIADGPTRIALIRRDTALECMVADAVTLGQYIRTHGVTEITVTDAAPVPWVQRSISEETFARTLLERTARVGWYAAGGALVLAAFGIVRLLLVSADAASVEARQQAMLTSFVPQVQSLKLQPLTDQTSELRHVIAFATETHGRVRTYRRANDTLAYAVDVPTWVGQDQLAKLGNGYRTELDKAANAIHVTRGAP